MAENTSGSQDTTSGLRTFCRAYGTRVDPRAAICPSCGVTTGMDQDVFPDPEGRRHYLVALLLSIFLFPRRTRGRSVLPRENWHGHLKTPDRRWLRHLVHRRHHPHCDWRDA